MEMMLANNFLKETPLTSTKNKLLIQPDLTGFYDTFLIREVNEANHTLLTSTKNEYLEKYLATVVPMQKRKRRKKYDVHDQSAPSAGKLRRLARCVPQKKMFAKKSSSRCPIRSRSISRSGERCYSLFKQADYDDDFCEDRIACAVSDEVDHILNDAAPESSSFVGTYASGTLGIDPPLGGALLFGSNSTAAPLFGSTSAAAPTAPPPGNAFGSAFGSSDGCIAAPRGFSFGLAQEAELVTELLKENMRSSALRSRGQYLRQKPAPPCPIPYVDILAMPGYNFDHDNIEIDSYEYDSFNKELHNDQLEKVHHIKSKKLMLLNAVSMALMCTANLKDVNEQFRVFMQDSADSVRQIDPEFILKVALYARQELNIRSVANFLLSYAAYHENTRTYLEKYFESSVILPTDWIEVADFYQTYTDKSLPRRSLPASLRRVMKSCFRKFDEYQLAKYNRCKTKKSTKKEIDNEPSVELNFGPIVKSSKGYTLKQLIRILHIDTPANEVMCLLGKKYPETADAFKKSGLSGNWKSKLAGKRMKLTQPMTWETQISANGNKSNVWESLIDANKLPYMAMLRNLRNLILSGISQKHHEKVLKHLQNKNAVINSRQVPLQFYEAYKVVSKLAELLRSDKENTDTKTFTSPWKQKHIQKTLEKIKNASLSTIDRYQIAISKALEISSLHNLHPIPGKTLIICDVLIMPLLRINKQKVFDTCLMMGLMCFKACEHSKMYLIFHDMSSEITVPEDEDFLETLMDQSLEHKCLLQNLKSGSSAEGLKTTLKFYLKQQTILSEKLDHIIFLKALEGPGSCEIKDTMSSFLNKYRQIVNPDLLYTDVSLSSSNKCFSGFNSEDTKDIYLCGNSTQLIKFIAERSSDGQLTYVENIDTKYNLKNKIDLSPTKGHIVSTNQNAASLYSRIPKWHSVRIFISSTFKDMHSERDILVRYVIPELRRRAASICVKINEVDLRWGITEADCATKRASELCLIEAQNSDMFVGILGERYGSIYNFDAPDIAELQWVHGYDISIADISITELEMYAGALREEKLAKKKGFFYFRNNSFLSLVPDKYKDHFASESPESKQSVEKLKSVIRSSVPRIKLFDGYPCNFAGIFKGKPILSGLDSFGKTVLEDLWHAISEVHKEEPYLDSVMEEENQQQSLLSNFDCFIGQRNTLADNFAKRIIKEYGIFIISGAPGCGKTTFMVNLLDKLKNFTVIKFFVGLTPRSTDITYMLHFISESIARKLSVSAVFPKSPKDIRNNFPDILQEADNSGNGNVILLIDGIDHLESNDEALDWIPLTLPSKMRLIFSASDTSHVFKTLCERQAYGDSVYIEYLIALPQSERESIIRYYLDLYGKSLEESSFNNQMLHMVTKKDSGIPLYLRVARDYLKTYASFENFTSMLQNLPTSISLIFQELIIQMENEYSSALVQAAFTLLCIAKEGLDDRDLHLLLSVHMLTNKSNTYYSFEETVKNVRLFGADNMLPRVTYYSLFHLICTFAFGYTRSENLNLVGSELEKAVKKYYLNKNFVKSEKSMHVLLAAYYFTLCDPENNGTWKTCSGPMFRGLLYHLFNGKCLKELANALCNLTFLEAAFKVDACEALQEYYTYFETKQGSQEMKELNVAALLSFQNFVSRNMHILQNHPELTLQQALNELPESFVEMDSIKRKSCMVECLLQPNVSDNRISTLGGFIKPITAVACHERKGIAALGSEDGYLKILDFTSKKIIRNLKNHTSAINFICFSGKNQICTASKDATLNVWNSEDFSLISTLTGHRRNVTCCCADPSGSILFSCGWDNSIRLWSLRDGRSISILDDFRCPVNCIDHHPMKQQVACGLWNGNIEIWDTVSLKRIITSASQCGSVKSIAYSPDGINIISAFISSEVAIWSSEEGLKLSSLTGHALPVKSIVFDHERNMIVSGSQDCTLKVWPTETGLSVNTLTSCKFCPISMLEFISHDCIAIVFQNSDIWVMNVYTGHVVSKLPLPSEMVTCISKRNHISYISKNTEKQWLDSCFVFGTQNGKVLIGDYTTSSIIDVGVTKSRITSITHIATMIACGNSDGDITIFSYPDFEPSFAYGAHQGSVTSLFLYEELMIWIIMSSGYEKVLKHWAIDRNDENQLKIEHYRDSMTKHNDCITSSYYVTYSKDDITPKLLTGSHDNTVILQDFEDIILTGLKTSVIKVCYMDGYILGCASDGSIAIWSRFGKLSSYVPGIEQSSVVLSFLIEMDANNKFDVTLAYVDKNGTVKITKPIQKLYSYSLEGHNKSITSCCANRNGEILSSSLDGTINFWKVITDVPDTFLNHKSSITGILLSMSQNIVISSDVLGNIILWKLDQSPKYALTCAAKKSYEGCFIKALTWLEDSTFIAAVTQVCGDMELHYLDVISFARTDTDEKDSYLLIVSCSHYFESEVLCLDACLATKTIVASFKSGDVVVITPNSKRRIETTENWVVGAKVVQSEDLIEYLFISLLNGHVKCFLMTEVLQDVEYKNLKSVLHSTNESLYTTTFYCEKKDTFFCGDSEGNLKFYKDGNLCNTKKIHESSITGIVVIGNYVFTSSLDRTIKGFILTTLQQVCLFYSSVPITSLAGQEVSLECSNILYMLMIGTSSGGIQLLKFHPI